jgi:DNA-binding winged helix-turn-helix (wHTH) protein/pimeloyl-ACP methyl ester carboxylesterase
VRFAFDELILDLSRFELRHGSEFVSIEPQAFDVLAYLIRHRDRVVRKEELMDEVWGGRFVTEAAVTSRIKQVRRAIGDDGNAQRLIKTVHGRGYRFVADVRELDPTPSTEPRSSRPRLTTTESASTPSTATDPGVVRSGAARPVPPVAYTETDGLQIAYQVTGDGPVDIVLVSGFISHLELDWTDPDYAHFLDRLGSMGRLIRFDKRGTGMSDRPIGLPDLETRMHDVLAVMDATRSRRAMLVGYSEGGPLCILFAATHPERALGIAMYGSYAKRTQVPDQPWAQPEAERRAYTERLVTTWDWHSDGLMRAPSGGNAMASWWARRSRAATTPSSLRALVEMNSLVDVRDLLGSVRVPALVLHRVDDPVVTVDNGRYLARSIPGAQYVELPGADHLPAVDPDQILDPIDGFIAEAVRHEAPSRSLAAVVALESGVGQGGSEVADALAELGGRRRSTGDGDVLVTFDGPATAVRAFESWSVANPSAEVAAGLHIAELPRDADHVSGAAVALARALALRARPAEVRMSAVVRELLSGSGIEVVPVRDGEAEYTVATG